MPRGVDAPATIPRCAATKMKHESPYGRTRLRKAIAEDRCAYQGQRLRGGSGGVPGPPQLSRPPGCSAQIAMPLASPCTTEARGACSRCELLRVNRCRTCWHPARRSVAQPGQPPTRKPPEATPPTSQRQDRFKDKTASTKLPARSDTEKFFYYSFQPKQKAFPRRAVPNRLLGLGVVLALSQML